MQFCCLAISAVLCFLPEMVMGKEAFDGPEYENLKSSFVLQIEKREILKLEWRRTKSDEELVALIDAAYEQTNTLKARHPELYTPLFSTVVTDGAFVRRMHEIYLRYSTTQGVVRAFLRCNQVIAPHLRLQNVIMAEAFPMVLQEELDAKSSGRRPHGVVTTFYHICYCMLHIYEHINLQKLEKLQIMEKQYLTLGKQLRLEDLFMWAGLYDKFNSRQGRKGEQGLKYLIHRLRTKNAELKEKWKDAYKMAPERMSLICLSRLRSKHNVEPLKEELRKKDKEITRIKEMLSKRISEAESVFQPSPRTVLEKTRMMKEMKVLESGLSSQPSTWKKHKRLLNLYVALQLNKSAGHPLTKQLKKPYDENFKLAQIYYRLFARARMNMGEYAEVCSKASREISDMINENPTSARLWAYKGMIELCLNKEDKGNECLQKATKLDPNDEDLLFIKMWLKR